MIKKETITQTAQRLWKLHEERDPRALCEILDITIIDMPMGTSEDSIKGLVKYNSRCYCIILNSDLDEQQQRFTLFHEIGHVVLKHALQAPCTCQNLLSTKETSVKEIEANEFVAEYLLNTDETLKTLHDTNSFFDTAKLLEVPPEILDFKWRMLRYYQLVSGECPILTASDCMKNLDCGINLPMDTYFYNE